MNSLSKSLSLLLAVSIVVTGVLIIQSTSAQTIPQPAVPQFTLKLTDNSYDVAPITTSTIDPYNGKTITTTTPGYQVKQFTIDLTIENQHSPSTLNGNKSTLYYNVRIKGHFAQDWTEEFPYGASSAGSLQPQSSSGYTVISFPANYREGDQIDFQVQAVLGYEYSYLTNYYGQTTHIMPMQVNTFNYQSSSWSPTQTFTMPSTSSISSNPTPTPTAPEFPISAILPLFVVIPLVAAILLRRGNHLKAGLTNKR